MDEMTNDFYQSILNAAQDEHLSDDQKDQLDSDIDELSADGFVIAFIDGTLCIVPWSDDMD